MPDKITLTEDRIRALKAPPEGELLVWDREVSGFGVRCYGSGRKVYFLQYRAGHGRGARQRRMTLGLFGTLGLADARKAARVYQGEIAAGRDPQSERREAIRRDDARLDRALDAYDAHLKRRKVVNQRTIMVTLRRELLGPIGKVDLCDVDRHAIAKQITRLEKEGKAGAAQDLRAKATTFLNWAVNRGLMFANPLAGWRRERATRALMTRRSGRALSDTEIRAVWEAADAVVAPFGDFVRLLILLGQRRGETVLMGWSDVDLNEHVWIIPAEVTKNGREHSIPLPQAAVEIIQRQPRFKRCPFVFAGRGGVPMSGWSKRLLKLQEASTVACTLHDFRRTFRSGLSRLGIDGEIAELMLNHTRADLLERYDREPRWAEREAAARRWAEHVLGAVGQSEDRCNVVEIPDREAV